jgi:hypothetical protein
MGALNEHRTLSYGTFNAHYRATLGASGADPAASTAAGAAYHNDIFGNSTPTNNGSGLYTYLLSRNVSFLENYNVQIRQSTYNAGTGACKARLVTDNVNGGSGAASISFQFQNEAGANVQPASGDVVRIALELRK